MTEEKGIIQKTGQIINDSVKGTANFINELANGILDIFTYKKGDE